jgi:hypothetical protein
MNRVLAAAFLAFAVTLAAPLAAQDPAPSIPQVRRGPFLSIGGGFGSQGVTCDGCDPAREGSFIGLARVGTALTRSTTVALEGVFWSNTIDDETVSFGYLSLIGQYYLEPTGGVFLKGGAGTTIGRAPGGDTSGAGITLGFGWDYRFSEQLSLTPSLNWHRGVGQTENPTMLGFAMALTWH